MSRLCPDCDRGIATYRMTIDNDEEWSWHATEPGPETWCNGWLLCRDSLCRTCGGTGLVDDHTELLTWLLIQLAVGLVPILGEFEDGIEQFMGNPQWMGQQIAAYIRRERRLSIQAMGRAARALAELREVAKMIDECRGCPFALLDDPDCGERMAYECSVIGCCVCLCGSAACACERGE